jgi:DNA-binding MarR family transcriptional regulator
MNRARRHQAEASRECQVGSTAPASTPAQEVFLGILKTADELQTELAELLKPADLSPTQYNVLRILRGAGDTGLACGQIAARMLTHDPDITRLLDRLEKRGVIERFRDKEDRRVVRAHITAAGRRLLARFDEPVNELHDRQLGHMGPRDLKSLAELLRRARERT